MFYATQIKSVHSGGAIDVSGRSLRFIGYMPVKAGDTVYTDGKIIFGNAPPKGAPVIFNEQSGIPVLGTNLRGYFTPQGRYKNYGIADDDWIVNDKKKYRHGDIAFDGEKIIDADITDSGDEFITTGGVYHDSHTLETTCVKMPVGDYRLFFYDRYAWTTYKYYIYIKGEAIIKQTLGSDAFHSWKNPIKVFLNGTMNKQIDLQPYAKDVENRALLCAERIMAQSYTEADVEANDIYEDLMSTWYPPYPLEQELQYDYRTYEYIHVEKFAESMGFRLKPGSSNAPRGTVDGNASTHPNEPFIAYTTAYVITSSFNANGLEGIVFASTYGYCFPYVRPRFIRFFSSHYYKLYEWKCVPFGMSCFYKIGGDSTQIEPFAYRDFGGIDSDLTIIKDDKAFFYYFYSGARIDTKSIFTLRDKRHVTLLSGFVTKEIDPQLLLPVGNGFYHMDKFGRLTFFDSKKNKVAEDIAVHDNYYHIEVEHAEFPDDFVTPTFNDKPQLICKVYTSDGKVEEKKMLIGGTNLNDGRSAIAAEQGDVQSHLAPIDGYYIKYPTGVLEPLQFTPLFYQFSNGSCLYGVKDGKLYYKTAGGTAELIGNGLKNFRLRELKNISKARR